MIINFYFLNMAPRGFYSRLTLVIKKIVKSKSEKDLEGLFRFFTFSADNRQLIPRMDTWKRGEIKWEKPKDNNDNRDNNDNKK